MLNKLKNGTSFFLAIIVIFSVFTTMSYTTSAINVNDIPDDAFEFNDHYYKVYDGVCDSWVEAVEYCESLGGHLATITSHEENEAVYSYITSCSYKNAYFGFSDRINEGTWEWVNGENSEYTNWHSYEPNNESRNEDYAMFYWKYSDGTWNDGNFGQGTESDDLSFICEWDDSYFFKLKEDTNQFVHSSTSYYLDNEKYRKRLYLDSLLTWDSTFRIYDEIYSGDVGGVCHGIALSMCYAKNGNLDLNTLNNGKQTNNYWDLGSLYDSDKSKFKDLVTYYQLTQLTANGAESYSVAKNGWHLKSLNERLTDFLQKFKLEAERSEREKKPFVFSFCYKLNGKVSGHSVVVCGYSYNDNTNEHEILVYDENTYPNVRYSTFKISSDYSSFTFTDSNGENSGYMISDIWTNLEVYDIDKLYGGNSNSITVVNGRQIVSANNTTSLNITAYKKFKLINDKGEYLEYDGNNYKGNMNVYDCKLVDNLDGTSSWKIEVPNSSKFEFLDTEDDIEIIGENYVGGFYVQTDSTDKLVVDGGNITFDGDYYDLDVALQTEGTKDFIRIQGKAGGNTVVSNENDKINAQSNKYLSAVNVVSYGSDTVNEEKVDNVVSSITIENNSGEVVNENILPYIFGDANSDGLVNAKDRMYLTRHLAKWNGYETIDECSADVNGDGIVNAKDRMILTRYLAKWKDYTTLPYNK